MCYIKPQTHSEGSVRGQNVSLSFQFQQGFAVIWCDFSVTVCNCCQESEFCFFALLILPCFLDAGFPACCTSRLLGKSNYYLSAVWEQCLHAFTKCQCLSVSRRKINGCVKKAVRSAETLSFPVSLDAAWGISLCTNLLQLCRAWTIPCACNCKATYEFGAGRNIRADQYASAATWTWKQYLHCKMDAPSSIFGIVYHWVSISEEVIWTWSDREGLRKLDSVKSVNISQDYPGIWHIASPEVNQISQGSVAITTALFHVMAFYTSMLFSRQKVIQLGWEKAVAMPKKVWKLHWVLVLYWRLTALLVLDIEMLIEFVLEPCSRFRSKLI